MIFNLLHFGIEIDNVPVIIIVLVIPKVQYKPNHIKVIYPLIVLSADWLLILKN